MTDCATVSPVSPTGSPGRDRLTLVAFLTVLVQAMLQGVAGAMIPLIKADVPMTLGQVSMHPAALAVGGLLVTAVLEPLRGRFGRWWLLTGAAVLAIAAGVLLGVAQTPVLTIAAFVLGGAAVSLTVVAGQMLLVAHTPGRSDRAIAEFNVAYAVGAVLASALMPIVARELHWRVYPIAWAGLVLLLVLPMLGLVRRDADGVGQARAGSGGTPPGRSRTRVPALASATLVLAATVEWGFLFWSPTYVTDVGGLTAVQAADVAWVLLAALLVGRVAGSRLMPRIGAGWTMAASLALSLAAVPVLMTATTSLGAGAAYALGGLAAANVYPAGVLLVVQAYPQRADAAVARAALITFGWVIVFPLILGVLADNFGLAAAFWVIPATSLVAAVVLFAAGPRAPEPAATA